MNRAFGSTPFLFPAEKLLLQAGGGSNRRPACYMHLQGVLSIDVLSLKLPPEWRPVNQTAAPRGWGPSRAKSASRSLQRALLMPQVNTGPRYRCGKRT